MSQSIKKMPHRFKNCQEAWRFLRCTIHNYKKEY